MIRQTPAPAPPSSTLLETAPMPPVSAAEIETTPRTPKPWGHELVFAAGEHGYVGKVIVVAEGQALSLQWHEAKDETIAILSGDAQVEHGPSVDLLVSRRLSAGESIHIPPGVLHRITALTDVTFVEASTAGPGWREDVVRVSDRYGRSGTSAP
jgi:mannose-6-phosphate isomerase-like protein (cupin superfamily)